MISIPQRLLGEALISSAQNHPLKIAIVFNGEEYSYLKTKDASLKLASHLLDCGIKKGDRIAVFMNNSWHSVVAIYGITLAGGVFLIINPQTKPAKLRYILNDSGARLIISEDLLKSALSTALESNINIEEVILAGADLRQLKINQIRWTAFDSILNVNISGISLPDVIPTDLAALIYTSGSTGFPKGVMMTHLAMVYATWSLIQYLRFNEDERILLMLPLSFDYGLYQLLMAFSSGATLIVEHSFTFPASIYNQIRKLEPSVLPGVPTIFSMMIGTHIKTGLSFECVKKITNTAAALPEEFIPFLRKIFPNALIFKMYGLTECKRVCFLEPELIDRKPFSVGKPIPGTEVFLLDQNGNQVPVGEPGILYIRGPHVMSGYWNKPELTDEMLKPWKIPGERILCSGDLFKMDEEGFLYFIARTDDIIKTRGEKVSPLEIENVIYKLKEVKEVAVVGIPDKIMGESIIAFVTANDGKWQNEEEVLKVCNENTELFMIPRKVIFLREMPKNLNGKIDKLQLRDQAISSMPSN
jgi:long-chain acyl-CoA synthetase